MRHIDNRCLENCRYFLFSTSNSKVWMDEGCSGKVKRLPTDEEIARCRVKVEIIESYNLRDLIAIASRGYERLVNEFFKKTNTTHRVYLIGSRAVSETPPRPCSDYDLRVVPLDEEISRDSDEVILIHLLMLIFM